MKLQPARLGTQSASSIRAVAAEPGCRGNRKLGGGGFPHVWVSAGQVPPAPARFLFLRIAFAISCAVTLPCKLHNQLVEFFKNPVELGLEPC